MARFSKILGAASAATASEYVRYLLPSARMGSSRWMTGSVPVIPLNAASGVYHSLMSSSGIGASGSHSGVLSSGVPSTAADSG
jgi:hypothetical protein